MQYSQNVVAIVSFALCFLAALSVAVASPRAPQIVRATYDVDFIDIVFEGPKPKGAEDILEINDNKDELQVVGHSHFDIAIINIYFDQPIYLNGTMSLPDVHRFLRSGASHRQTLYGKLIWGRYTDGKADGSRLSIVLVYAFFVFSSS